MSWRTAFIAQARSDYAVFERLSASGVEFCHPLHYLQMTAEKLAKGILTSPSQLDPPEPTHAVFVTLLQVLKGRPDIRRRLGFTDAAVFRRYIDSLIGTAFKIERLAPAIAGFTQANPEYPWRSPENGQIIAPSEFAFAEFNSQNVQLRKTLLLIRALLTLVI